MPLKPLLTKAEQTPKKLFIIDGLGAILSAFMLGIMLVQYEVLFGMPSSALYILATIPLFFAAYDCYFYRKKNRNIGLDLKRIAGLNVVYCCVSIGCSLYHSKSIKSLGWAYLFFEITIVLVLAMIEYRVGRKEIQKKA